MLVRVLRETWELGRACQALYLGTTRRLSGPLLLILPCAGQCRSASGVHGKPFNTQQISVFNPPLGTGCFAIGW
ncbi:hypothetical protein BJY00DRAFT_272426, partial [Aspergillus carlsbadensis]